MANVVTKKAQPRSAGRRRAVLWSFFIIMLGALVLPLTGYVYTALAPAHAAVDDTTNPRANYWRAVRDGVQGYSAVTGQETNVLIQNGGENYRQVRNGPVVAYGAWLMAGVVFAIGLFHIIVGKSRLERRSGVKVVRWTGFDRFMHWFVAILFIILAITGLSLLYGRAVLIPIMGKQGFAAWADVAKNMHNYLAPFFIAGLALMLLVWLRESFFTRVDWAWLKAGGGYFGKGHASAGKVNAGEKVWFWVLFFVGIALCVSGFFLLFPNYGWERGTMQLASVAHAISGIVLIAFSLGHIYLGTLGNEGSLEGMVTGNVDVEWAKQHHDLWLEEVMERGQQATPAAPGASSPSAASPT